MLLVTQDEWANLVATGRVAAVGGATAMRSTVVHDRADKLCPRFDSLRNDQVRLKAFSSIVTFQSRTAAYQRRWARSSIAASIRMYRLGRDTIDAQFRPCACSCQVACQVLLKSSERISAIKDHQIRESSQSWLLRLNCRALYLDHAAAALCYITGLCFEPREPANTTMRGKTILCTCLTLSRLPDDCCIVYVRRLPQPLSASTQRLATEALTLEPLVESREQEIVWSGSMTETRHV